ncbi:sialate O-acetylesterase [Sphingobacterium sp. SG20118]|uniref:sialate O-acetylesterase n=1 Tax=Sphingobacterium sp. SG20118 TaxID=3367156 RepID=UPI0037DFC11F
MRIIAILFSFFIYQYVVAKIKLPALISDRMVLQRDVDLKLWGWADRGEKVTIRFQGKIYQTQPDADGKWFVTLPPQKAGGPFIMEVNELIIRDILIGDVWLASGQSNMETPILRLVDRYPEINVSNNHMIRYYKVPTQESVHEKDEIASGAQWYSAIASDVLKWTALAYFYAQEAYSNTGIPVGMLVASKGGSTIQSWINQDHLKEFPALIVNKKALTSLENAALDQGANKWHRTDWDDREWQTVTVPSRWNETGLDIKGTVWYRKDFDLPTSMEGRYAKLYLGTMVDSDSVFVNGKFVGFTSYFYPPRKYDIPAGILKSGKNNITIRLTANANDGGFIPDKPYKISNDEIDVDLKGTWKYKVGQDLNQLEQSKKELANIQSMGSGLYNGMINPLCYYQFKGVIWYQGESNAGDSNYGKYLKALITNWRAELKSAELPFLLVQLPNYTPKSIKPPFQSTWGLIREAQLQTALEVPKTAMAVTYDLGEWNDIHPLNKKDLAHRLFLQARQLIYGERLVSAGPVYDNMKIEGNKITLFFNDTGGGLRSREGRLQHFAIAGEDKVFVWAEAVIKGNTIIVRSKEVTNPVAVRYAWSDNPEEANLQNKERLLASPFRTDNW